MPNPQALLDQFFSQFPTHADALAAIAEYSQGKVKNPVSAVRWMDITKVEANDYNPNAVARTEMKLLLKSVAEDGYTQPIVTIHDKARDKYVIVDGFHRYMISRLNKKLLESNNGKVPIVVIDKDINQRMASTVRHNRARGKHSVNGMASIIFSMLDNGWTDAEVCNEIGLSPEEITKLKYVTGFAKLFENHEYSKAWYVKRQAKISKAKESTNENK